MLLLLLLLLWAGRGVGACGVGCLTCTASVCTSCSEGWAKDFFEREWDCIQCSPQCEKCHMYEHTWMYGLQWYFQMPAACERCSVGYYQNPAGTFACTPCKNNCNSCVLETGVCSQCRSGFYRTDPPYQGCTQCILCMPWQKETQTCNIDNDRRCERCPSNSMATTYECIACVDRVTYASEDQSRCDTCTTCTTAQYLPSGNECTGSRNAICLNCADNRMSMTTNSLTCNTCANGYYLSGTTGTCVDCATPNCPTNTYIRCANGIRTCVVCAGNTLANACTYGKEPNQICTGTQRSDSTCVNCGPGSERLTANVGTTLMCVQCSLGNYKVFKSTDTCRPCSNKPAENSLYLAWGNQIPSSNTCPW